MDQKRKTNFWKDKIIVMVEVTEAKHHVLFSGQNNDKQTQTHSVTAAVNTVGFLSVTRTRKAI